MPPGTVADRVRPGPGGWGLRGDPLPWEEMTRAFADTPGARRLRRRRATGWHSPTGAAPVAPEGVELAAVPRYVRGQGGRSGGPMSPRVGATRPCP